MAAALVGSKMTKIETTNIDSMLTRLDRSITSLSDNIVRLQQRNIVVDVNEYAYTFNDTSLLVNARSRGAIKVTGILAVFTSNVIIKVGNHIFSVPAAQSPFAIGGLVWVINQDELRGMSQATQGAMSLEIFGEEYGDVGVL